MDPLVLRAQKAVAAALEQGVDRDRIAAALANFENSLSTQSTPLSGLAAFLLFDQSGGGKLFMQWSDGPVDGALACFVPIKAVPKFKLTSNAGRSDLIGECGTVAQEPS